eukprot:COSAG04_NODE_398_length_14962_cov_39.977461_14_plen_446_part_00
MVQQRASLTITHVLLRVALSVSGDGASLDLVDCTLHPTARVTATGGSTLGLASMAVPFPVWTAAEDALADSGSTMRFDSLRVDGYASWGELTGSEIIEADGSRTSDPPSLGSAASGIFIVTSGCSGDGCEPASGTPPCHVTRGGRCVGRAAGYGPNEHCAITVGGGGGALGPCAVFDTGSCCDRVTLPGGAQHGGSDCPEGAALGPGDAIAWTSNDYDQGSVGHSVGHSDNGCAAEGTCGLPFTYHGPDSTSVVNDCGPDRDQPCPNGLGGGWELCFAGGWGCTNPAATNYDPAAAADDGSCAFAQCDDCAPFFIVTSGFTTCSVSNGGRCVGRPRGYGPDEDCAITVGGGGGGVLGPCPVFDTWESPSNPCCDSVTLPGGHYGRSDCPEGAALVPGDAIAWHSDGNNQGTVGYMYSDNGCAAKGTCGLPYSSQGLGGGWELCFA